MSTPDMVLQTAFVLNEQGRIVSTREPGPSPGPLFSLVKGRRANAWAIRADVSSDVATAIDRLARQEPQDTNLDEAPLHATRYKALLAQHHPLEVSGPAFTFPAELPSTVGTVTIEDERLLAVHFQGWVAGEIAQGRAPVVAVVQSEYPVSVCFCARRSETAAEAGVETAAAFRGQALATIVTAAWARALRATGRVPLYRTEWTNGASLAVARKLGLLRHAATWSLFGQSH